MLHAILTPNTKSYVDTADEITLGEFMYDPKPKRRNKSKNE
ncbi:hypothetical protein SynBIOSE41_01686 [Synechococcus sp. BIOS-E4-1]|nr:hypothetical protein SynBIOSE41_01686 [Synechococcus sp. BIOS-E4-1]